VTDFLRTGAPRRPWRAPLALALLLPLTVLAGTAPASAATTALPAMDLTANPQRDLDEYEVRLVHHVNLLRARRGLPRVTRIDGCLDRTAEGWAAHLASTRQHRHRNMYALLDTCHLWWVGEDLAYTSSSSPGQVVQAWRNSPAHRAVLLKASARVAGVGVRRGSDGVLYIVLTLGRR